MKEENKYPATDYAATFAVFVPSAEYNAAAASATPRPMARMPGDCAAICAPPVVEPIVKSHCLAPSSLAQRVGLAGETACKSARRSTPALSFTLMETRPSDAGDVAEDAGTNVAARFTPYAVATESGAMRGLPFAFDTMPRATSVVVFPLAVTQVLPTRGMTTACEVCRQPAEVHYTVKNDKVATLKPERCEFHPLHWVTVNEDYGN